MKIDTNNVLENFYPLKQVCAHLNAFHAYADDPSRYVETNHYCSHVNEGSFYLGHHIATVTVKVLKQSLLCSQP